MASEGPPRLELQLSVQGARPGDPRLQRIRVTVKAAPTDAWPKCTSPSAWRTISFLKHFITRSLPISRAVDLRYPSGVNAQYGTYQLTLTSAEIAANTQRDPMTGCRIPIGVSAAASATPWIL